MVVEQSSNQELTDHRSIDVSQDAIGERYGSSQLLAAGQLTQSSSSQTSQTPLPQLPMGGTSAHGPHVSPWSRCSCTSCSSTHSVCALSGLPDGTWQSELLEELPGRVRDALVVRRSESFVEIATVARSGRLALLRIDATGTHWTTIHEAPMVFAVPTGSGDDPTFIVQFR